MTTDTEALRAAFEDYVNPEGDVALHWQPAGYYAGVGLQGSWLDFRSGYLAGVAAERERAAAVCERIADDYNQRESLKYAELKTDAETGANECAYAIRAKEPSDG